jgi:hypothetical protein
MAERKCLMTFYPTKCKDKCFNCECGGAEATKDMYVSIHDVQRVCTIIGGASDTNEGEYVAEVIRNNLENMVVSVAELQNVKQWVKLQDRHPDTEGSYYVCDQYGECEVAEYLPNIKSWFTHKIKGEIQYWTHLPKPPKDGDING